MEMNMTNCDLLTHIYRSLELNIAIRGKRRAALFALKAYSFLLNLKDPTLPYSRTLCRALPCMHFLESFM
uniref:Putative ovule protein n=1 Tax=Solanum chacoense TaxID=4108 RepID=A0A0V0GX60_SOLCH